MAKVGTAEYDVEISRAKVRAEVDAAGKEIEKGLGQAADKAAKEIEDKLSQFRGAAGLGITAGTTLLLKNATDSASSLAEAQGKARSVFADSYDEVQRFAAGAAQALGQSERQVLDSVGTYGNLLQAMGLSTEQAKDMSIEFVKLGTDLAAFSDIPVDEAIVALRSGLSGETEPLKKFGVNLTQARIEAEALTQGLWDGEGAIDSAAKAQAAYSIILQDTTLAQGTFARESDSAAGQMRIAGAEAENTSASIGEALLPVMAKAAEVVGVLARAFGDLPGPVQTGIVGVGGLTLGLSLLAPKIREGFQVLQLAGSKAASLGKDLVVPTKAIDGLGSVSDAATPKVGKLATALGLVGVAMASAAAAKYAQGVSDAVDASDKLLKSTDENLLKLAVMWSAVNDGAFMKTDLSVLYAMRDAAAEAGVEVPKLTSAIAEKEQVETRGAAATAKYAAEVAEVTGASDGAADATSGLAADVKTAAEEFEGAASAARELFDARRQAQSAANGVADAERAVTDAYGGVADAQDAVRDASRGVQDAQQSLRDAHRGVEAAAKGVQDAHKGLADAQRDAADAADDLVQAQRDQLFGTKELEQANRGVEDAEKALAQAQRESKDAQDALNDARATAAERLADLEEAVDRQGLDEERAELALARARERQRELGKDGREVSGLDRREAALAIQEAENRLADVLEANAEREEKLAEERKKGIEGSDEVAAAKDSISDAAGREKEAEESLSEARERVTEVQEELAQRVVEAHDRVVEANDRVIEANGRIVKAQQGVEDATRRVAEAHDGVAEAQGRVVEAREAVVEAQVAVEEAQRKVVEANLARIFSEAAVKEQTDGSRAATHFQIDELGRLAQTLDPNDPLRRHLQGLIGDLEAASGTWAIDVVLGIRSGEIEIGTEISLSAAEAALGRRAGGGRVRKGVPYLVGDDMGLANAEVMVPDEDGVIVPSIADWGARQPVGAGVGGRGDTFQIDASGIKDPDQLASSISSVQAWRASLEVH